MRVRAVDSACGLATGNGQRRLRLTLDCRTRPFELREATLPTKKVYMFAAPGFADWEPAHALAEVRRHGHYEVRVVGLTLEPVRSMGGLSVQPDMMIADVDPDDVAIFIVPGGDVWERQPPDASFLELLSTLDAQAVPIAAICAATTVIARAGLLRGRQHTSNGLEYLKQHVAEYAGDADYVDASAVRDRGLITASGLADVEFAREVMAELGILNEKARAFWSEMFRSARIHPSAITTSRAARSDGT
jgi:putative intracellular protease/amidase